MFMLLKDLIEAETKKKPTLYMPIAPSGAGKSTYFQKLKAANPNLQSFSWDDLRIQWYGGSYGEAYEKAKADPDFETKARAEYGRLVSNRHDIYVDNTNLTRERRDFYTQKARAAGYHLVGIPIPYEEEEVVARQKTRGDKCIRADVVRDQCAKLEKPYPGEFHEIITSLDK